MTRAGTLIDGILLNTRHIFSPDTVSTEGLYNTTKIRYVQISTRGWPSFKLDDCDDDGLTILPSSWNYVI